MLVIVDQLSGWAEASPTRKADTAGVVKALLQEIIPRYGTPETIESDRGSHFSAGVLNNIYKSLGIQRQLDVAYHPQLSGQVERMNRTLKNTIAQTCSQVGLKWPEVLRIVLWDIRNTPRQPLGLSPAEIVFGRHLAVPGTFVPTNTSLLDGDEQVTRFVLGIQKHFKKTGHKPNGFNQYQ